METSVLYPVQVLREHITELEAAVALCLADARQKPVHKLRTETRRLGALLLLLTRVPKLPKHHKEAAAFQRALRKLRRAAGDVRDFDVHRSMLKALSGAVPDKSGSGEGTSVPKNAAVELRRHMRRERDKAAAALQQLLAHRQVKTTRAAEALLESLRPAQRLAVAGPDLLRDAQAVLVQDGFLDRNALGTLSEEDLHTVRKAAKAARYVAECQPDDPALAAAARRFESLQEAGGQWHDALELARAARLHFGKDHVLTRFYRQERDRKLEAYRAALESERGSAAESPTVHRKHKPVSATRLISSAAYAKISPIVTGRFAPKVQLRNTSA